MFGLVSFRKFIANKYQVIVLVAVSLVWGYVPDWLPKYVSQFQSRSVIDLGQITKFASQCHEVPTESTYCSDEYRIPMSKLPMDLKNKSIGLGFLTSEVVVGCVQNGIKSPIFYLGDLDRPYRKGNIFREYRVLAVDSIKCSGELFVQTWVRPNDIRHGLIAGDFTVGESAAIDDLKKLLEYSINGVMLAILILCTPLLIALYWLGQTLKTGGQGALFKAILTSWLITILLISGLLQISFPVASIHLISRIIANWTLLFSFQMTGVYFLINEETIDEYGIYDIKISEKYQFIEKNISKLVIASTVIPTIILFFNEWPTYRTACSILFGVLFFVLGLLNKRFELILTSVLCVLSELKIFNTSWAPESSTYVVFIFFILVLQISLIFRAQISRMLLVFVENTANDKLIAAQVVHDIRSPLTALKFLIGQVEWKMDQGEVRETVLDSINRISSISSKVLKEQSQMHKKFSDSTPIFDAIREAKLNFVNSINFHVELEASSFFAIDSETFYRVCQNLIKNACEAKDVKNIYIRTLSKDNGHELLICNDGLLPTKKFIEKIFNTGGTLGKKNGNGLGVQYCKTEIEKRSGRFSISINAEGLFEAKIDV